MLGCPIGAAEFDGTFEGPALGNSITVVGNALGDLLVDGVVDMLGDLDGLSEGAKLEDGELVWVGTGDADGSFEGLGDGAGLSVGRNDVDGAGDEVGVFDGDAEGMMLKDGLPEGGIDGLMVSTNTTSITFGEFVGPNTAFKNSCRSAVFDSASICREIAMDVSAPAK